MLSIIVRLLILKKNTNRTIIFTIIGIIALTIIIQTFMINLIDFLINISLGTSNTSRLIEIKNFVITSQMGDLIRTRVDTWVESLVAFSNYPILGVIQNKLYYSGGWLIGFGQHSQFLDTFALFGFGIGLLQIYIFTQPIFIRVKGRDGVYFGMSLLLLLLLIILFTLNNATPSIGFALFFIFPTVYDRLEKKETLPKS